MSDTYLSEGSQIVLKEEFRNILVDFENAYFGTDTDVFEDYSNKLLELFNRVIADLETKLADMEQEQIKEMQEHQEAMHVADNTIKMLEKALELACEWINDIQEMDSDCPIYADCFRVEKDCDNWDCGICDCSKFAIDHFKTKAKEMMKSE